MVFLKGKSAGFYFTAIAVILGLAAAVQYLIWAPEQDMMDMLILLPLIAGSLLGTLFVFIEIEHIIVGAAACFSIALFKLISISVGAFVDAFQGIVMFGDSSQIGTIITICVFIAVSCLSSIAASFMRVKRR
jgi:hypothetical protein